jgi:hypothetical protein
MPFKSRFRGAAFRRPYRTTRPVKVSAVAFAALCAAATSLGIAEAAARVQALAVFTSAPSPAAAPAPIRVQASFPTWQGVDLDGDGQADVADPTGREPREVDAYGEGASMPPATAARGCTKASTMWPRPARSWTRRSPAT